MEHEPEMQLAEALHAAGLTLRGKPVMDDRIHRVDVEGKPGGRDGAYRAVIEGDRAYGWYQNWQIHPKPVGWHTGGLERLTPQQYRHLSDERAARDAARVKEQHEQHENTAKACKTLWDNAAPVDLHPYLDRKGVGSFGLRQNDGKLLVPVMDADEKLWSLQHISPDGSKRFHEGGKVDGNHYVIGTLDRACPLLIAEGYATAASLLFMMHMPVVIAFNAGNLGNVTKAYRARFPERHIIVAGDNDHSRERELGFDGKPKPNVGKLKAIEAADAIDGIAVLPNFAPEETTFSDWNDKLRVCGIEDARAQFQRGMMIAEQNHQKNVSAGR